MMIIERPGQSLGAAQPVRRRRFSLDFAPLAFRGRPPTMTSAGVRNRPRLALAASSPTAATNTPLTSLEGEALARRFHVWSGRSGRRYICSVFTASLAEPGAGLPDFADAIIIAVGVAADGLRYPIAFFDCGETDGDYSDRHDRFLAEALAYSVREWHVHLLATDPEHRRCVATDLERAGDAGQEEMAPTCAPQEPLPLPEHRFKTAA
jgi:hypothetical protein